jgi:hypothetical protein
MTFNANRPRKAPQPLHPVWALAFLLIVVTAGCGRERGTLPPSLAAITPSHAAAGSSVTVTLSGANFDTGASIDVGGAAITVTQTTVVSPASITANFAVAAGATLGTAEISVLSGGQATNAVAFTLAAPLTVSSTNPGSGASGVAQNVTVMAVLDQPLSCPSVGAGSFRLATAAGVAVPGAVTCSGSTVALAPAAALARNTLYLATLTPAVTDAAGTALAAAYTWQFKTAPAAPAPPTVVVTNPAKRATGVPLNQQLAATFSEAMDPATITALTFQLTAPGGAAVAGTVSYAAPGSTATFTPAAPLTPLSVYVATVTTGVSSLTGVAMAANAVWSFTTGTAPDTTRPMLQATLPAKGATAVPINQAVTATFSKAMNPATLTSGSFTLTGPAGAVVAGLVTYAAVANTATFTPSAPLAASTLYTATVSTAAQDLAGNALGTGGAPNPWTFTTAAAADTTPPTIVSTNPADATTGVPVNATINATFSEDMDPLTISTSTFQVTDGSGQAVPGTVSYAPASRIATFTPLSNLTANTGYSATLTNGAADLAGNPLAAGLVGNPWNFTTAAAVLPVVDLGAASPFGGFGGNAGMTNQGTLTVIHGDIGTTGASTLLTGFHDPGTGCTYTETPLNVGFVDGLIYTAAPPPTVACPTEGTAATALVAHNAGLATLAAFNATSPALMPPTVAAQASELGGLTLPPGVYQSASGSFSISNGDLTLDAQGNANATWVFQAATSLTVGIAGPTGARNVILINGAQARNVFWHVGSAATINAAGGGTMVGTILAQAGISFSTAGNVALSLLNGRALVLTGPVTLVNTVITVPLP